jgi:hypothetical protein
VDEDFLRRCTHSDRVSQNLKLVLIGDSFAEVIAQHVAFVAQSFGYDFRTIYGYSCPYPLPFAAVLARAKDRCKEVNENLLERQIIEGLRPGDVVVLRLHYSNKHYVSYAAENLPPVDAYDASLKILYEQIREKGAQFVIIGSNPVLTEEDVKSLRRRWLVSVSQSERIRSDGAMNRYYRELDRHLSVSLSAKPGLYYLSSTDKLCDSDAYCLVRLNGKSIYSDHLHLNGFGVDLLYGQIYAKVKAIASDP